MSGTFVRYLAVGTANTAIGYGAILAFQFGAGLSPTLSNALGYAVGMVASYTLNRRFTFRSQRAHGTGVPAFVATAGLCYALNLACLHLLIGIGGMPPALAQAAAVATYTLAFYFVSKHLVFR